MSQPPTSPENLSAIYTTLGHAKRRGMVTALAYRPATVSQLAAECQVSLPAIHKHIRALEDAALIQRKKVGRTNFVALNRKALRQAQAWLMSFHAYWGTDEETLENYIDNLRQNQ